MRAALLADLGIPDRDVLWIPAGEDPEAATAELAPAQNAGGDAGCLVLAFERERPEPELARWREALWPTWHAIASCRLRDGELSRRTLQGRAVLGKVEGSGGQWVVFRQRLDVMSQRSTVAKFDQNAKGWDGDPNSPSYPHHRWMRRYVGCYAAATPGARILDFGSGAGWCGIEAARAANARELCAFDPSPQMVELARRNAEAHGIAHFRGEPGFGEAPPFPKPGEAPFELVISSGVISFVPEVEPWLDGLAACVAPGGRLIIGDIDARAYGFARRRRSKLLLPVRELNAKTPLEVRGWLERRGFRFERGSGYQLTWPVPQAMEYSERKLGGVLQRPLLWANQLGAALDKSLGGRASHAFDSWVMTLVRG